MNIWIFLCQVGTIQLLTIDLVVSLECHSPNVRTALWRSSDLYRDCWNDRDIAVLYARRIFQLVIPTKVPAHIPLLISHFKMCLEVVRDLASSKEAHALLIRPMADVIGGYLQAFGVPIATEEYYEGTVSYAIAGQMSELLKATKKLLSTDGGKWTQPIRVIPSKEICPFKVEPPSMAENHCNDLISSNDLLHKCRTEKEVDWLSAKVPLPFLDDNHHPKSIAVPFRVKTLYSLFDKNSRDILSKYYTAASQCYSVQKNSCDEKMTKELKKFDCSFHGWLVKYVVPLLHDGTWYPGFGGVYKILANMEEKGLKFPREELGTNCAFQCNGSGSCPNARPKTTWFFVACIIGFLVIFWFAVSVILIALRKNSPHSFAMDGHFIKYNTACGAPHSGDVPINLLAYNNIDQLMNALVSDLVAEGTSSSSEDLADDSGHCVHDCPDTTKEEGDDIPCCCAVSLTDGWAPSEVVSESSFPPVPGQDPEKPPQ